MGLIGSSDSGHHRSAKDAVVSARADDCANTAPIVMLASTAATCRQWACPATRHSARLARSRTDQNPPCKNNDMDPPTDNRSVKGEPGPEHGNEHAWPRIFLGVCYFGNKTRLERLLLTLARG